MASVAMVLPVYNEEHVLEASVERTLAYLDALTAHSWRVIIADNASTDGTLALAERLSERFHGRVTVQHIPVKGRGIALRTTWLTADEDILAYMDVDLSTGLEHIPELIDTIANGEADLSFGTRLHARSQTERGWKRELTSRVYVLLLRYLAGLRVTDAQCGFKAISRDAARALLPVVEDTQWFFDSELLLIAQKNGYRLHEVPVRWVEDRDSRVAVLRTALDDLRGIWRLRRAGIPHVARGTEGA